MWQGILGHDEVVDRFRRILACGRLASTYLFVGPPGIGKRQFALKLAHALLCTNAPESSLEPCGRCDSCRMFAANNHPDLDLVSLPADKSSLPIELFIGDREHRNQEGLCHRLGMKPFFGRRRVAIVDDADHFNINSANCLLKTLEEPPPGALLILIGTSPGRQLPTIRSRAQVVRFRALAEELLADILVQTQSANGGDDARKIAALSGGSLEQARQMAIPEMRAFHDQLSAALRATRLDCFRIQRSVQAFVEEAGKEATERRDRLRVVIGFAIDHFRSKMRTAVPADAARCVNALDACIVALMAIDRNANLGMVVQNWCENLSGGDSFGLAPLALTEAL